MNIAGLQLNVVVGDIAGNVEMAKAAINNVRNADLIVLSEMFVTGYPPRDLLLWDDFVEENIAATARLIAFTKEIPATCVFGCVETNPADGAKGLFNTLIVARGGKVLQRRYKSTLPTYDVFSERRYFEPGKPEDVQPVEIQLLDGTTAVVGFINCEEAWNDAEFWTRHEYNFDPVDLMVRRGAKHIVCINASPWRYAPTGADMGLTASAEESVAALRRRMIRKHCLDNGVGFTYVNQVGANDDIVFDGNSFAMNERGEIIAHAHHCAEDLMVFSTEDHPIREAIFTRPIEEDLMRVMILGVKDYFAKQPFLKSAWLGLSGGIDSALVAFLGTQALGTSRVTTLGLPTEYSSEGSVTDAQKLARRLGMDYFVVPIKEAHEAHRRSFNDTLDQMRLAGRSVPCGLKPGGLTDQNLQARIRDVTLMEWCNEFYGLMLLTGNKSESAVGYYTLYDMCGGLGVIADLYKTLVKRICTYINNTSREEIIPWNTINKPASAELAPDQKDSDSLPPYDWLDQILMRFIEDHHSSKRIIADLATVENEAKYANQTRDMGKVRNLQKRHHLDLQRGDQEPMEAGPVGARHQADPPALQVRMGSPNRPQGGALMRYVVVYHRMPYDNNSPAQKIVECDEPYQAYVAVYDHLTRLGNLVDVGFGLYGMHWV
jgi:NAD+ synthase (glutamine-hydrolysing)